MPNGFKVSFPAPTSAALGGFTQTFLQGLKLRRELEESDELRELRALRKQEFEREQGIRAARPGLMSRLAAFGQTGPFSLADVQAKDPELLAGLAGDPTLRQEARIQGLAGAERLGRERRGAEGRMAFDEEARRLNLETREASKTDAAAAEIDHKAKLSAAYRRLSHTADSEQRREAYRQQADRLGQESLQLAADPELARQYGDEMRRIREAADRLRATPEDPEAEAALREAFQSVKTKQGLQDVARLEAAQAAEGLKRLTDPGQRVFLLAKRVREAAQRQGRILTPDEEWAAVKQADPVGLSQWVYTRTQKMPEALLRVMGYDPKTEPGLIGLARELARRRGLQPDAPGYEAAVFEINDRLRRGVPDEQDRVALQTVAGRFTARLNSIDASLRNPNTPDPMRRELEAERPVVVEQLHEANILLSKRAGLKAPKPPPKLGLDPGQVRLELDRRLDAVAKAEYKKPFKGGLTKEQAKRVLSIVEKELSLEQIEALNRLKPKAAAPKTAVEEPEQEE